MENKLIVFGWDVYVWVSDLCVGGDIFIYYMEKLFIQMHQQLYI